MGYKTLLFLFVLFFSQVLWSKSDCFITEAMNDHALMNNTKFWDEFSVLMDRGELNAETYQNLARKFKSTTADANAHTASPAVTKQRAATSSSSRTIIETSKKADKDLAKLPKDLVGKYEEFVTMALSDEGVQGFYKNPGRWHIEKLKGIERYTVRLNKAVRVEFTFEKGKVNVLQVNADHVHDHLKK